MSRILYSVLFVLALASQAQAQYNFMGCHINLPYKANLPEPFSNFVESDIQAPYVIEEAMLCPSASTALRHGVEVQVESGHFGPGCFRVTNFTVKPLAQAVRGDSQGRPIIITMLRGQNGQCYFTGE